MLAESWEGRPIAPPVTTRGPSGPGLASEVVLLVGLSVDEHLNAVGAALARRGATVERMHADVRPVAGRPGYEPTAAPEQVRSVFLRSIDVIRPIAHHNERAARYLEPVPHLPAQTRGFAARESMMALLGRFDALRPRRWLNGYWEACRAEVKATQLRAAAAAGLRTPRTAITDRAADVRRLYEQTGGRVIYKSLGDPFAWEEEGAAGFLYATPLTASHLADLDLVLLHPGIFQEHLHAVAEYRVCVVAGEAFTVATPAAGTDWRRSLATSGVAFQRATLDRATEDLVIGLVNDLELGFATVDLIETDSGIYFLELNPSGAYLWLERALELPVSEAICDELLRP